MKKKWTIPCIVLAALAMLAVATVNAGPLARPAGPQAALGTAFTYQGQLNHDGQPVDNTCDFEFRLYDDEQGSTQVGATQTLTGVEVSGGLFTVQLDFGAEAFAGDARWLGIQVQCQGDAEYADLGLQALSATPQALYALGAPWDGLSDVPAGFADGVDDVAAVVSGTAIYAGEGLSQMGSGDAITLSVAPSYRLPQICSGGQVAKWDGAGWFCGDDNVGGSGSGWSLTGNAGTNPAVNFLGTTDAVTLTLAVSGTPALRLEPTDGAPNLIGGDSSVGAGVTGATVGGGYHNQATGDYTVVGGGFANVASGWEATVAGGDGNQATNDWASVGGGTHNQAGGDSATVAGGYTNEAGGMGAAIAGGAANDADGNYSAVGGGYHNMITATYATIGGGYYNQALASYATIGGGGGSSSATANRVFDEHGTVGGGQNNQAGNADGNPTSARGATVAGGHSNIAAYPGSAIGGGEGNVITDTASFSTIGGGWFNEISGYGVATIGGGYGNTINAMGATVPGGISAAATHYGEMAYASGFFDVAGDAQASLYVMHNTTTNATPTELFLDGTDDRLTIASDRTLVFDILIVARSDDGDSAGYQIRGVIENVNGATFFVGGAPAVTVLGEDVPAWTVTALAYDSHDALGVLVTGSSATNIHWVATVRTAEVAW